MSRAKGTDRACVVGVWAGTLGGLRFGIWWGILGLDGLGGLYVQSRRLRESREMLMP